MIYYKYYNNLYKNKKNHIKKKIRKTKIRNASVVTFNIRMLSHNLNINFKFQFLGLTVCWASFDLQIFPIYLI